MSPMEELLLGAYWGVYLDDPQTHGGRLAERGGLIADAELRHPLSFDEEIYSKTYSEPQATSILFVLTNLKNTFVVRCFDCWLDRG